MSIPVALQSFKSAGVYRLVYDKSTILNQDTQIMRLVIGYSAQGPFNTPVLVRSISEFKALYGEASKSLEKRGVFFHRLALQALLEGPIICLNLKRFSGETLYGATVDTTFNPEISPIDVVELNVEDIYDTTRFWELSAFKLAEITDVGGRALDGYISLSSTNTKNTSCTFFIRKASGSKVAGYNVTVNDWYKDSGDDVPEFLQNKLNNKISDFFAEIYIFKGQFTPEQVLSSETLKNYFMSVKKEDGTETLQLRPYVFNAYGDPVDTLDALYNEPTSGAISRYVGSLIPYFKDKQGVYQALDIIVNNDVDTNNVMMNLNVDLLEEGLANIDLSGRLNIPLSGSETLGVDKLYAGTAVTTLLGNEGAPVISDEISFAVNYKEVENSLDKKRIVGNYYVNEITFGAGVLDETGRIKPLDEQAEDAYVEATFEDIKNINEGTNTSNVPAGDDTTDDTTNTETNEEISVVKLVKTFKVQVPVKYLNSFLTRLSINMIEVLDSATGQYTYVFNGGAYCESADLEAMTIPDTLVTSVINYIVVGSTEGGTPAELENEGTIKYSNRMNFSLAPIGIVATSTQKNVKNNTTELLPNVYGSSVTFIPEGEYTLVDSYDGSAALTSETNSALVGFFRPGDCILAEDGTNKTDYDEDGVVADNMYDNVYVQETGSNIDETGKVTYYVKFSAKPYEFTDGEGEDANKFIVRIDAPLNQEIGNMEPIYLEGYTYNNPKPTSTSMYDKQKWQDFILSTLTDYKGIRTGLLNRSDLDYRYVIDTFETFVTSSAKSILSFLCREKQSAFAILNFPSVRTFVKCPYTSFTDSKGIFNIEYVVKGYNPKKSHTVTFSLPSETEGASFCAFYTPLKFTDGYVDSLIPSAALVSNLFVEKYRSRQPYYIVAGPNYGAISASGMTGPDYNYSREELNVIEPYGVNCMVYRPGFGTFINANQTAKQTPKSALSSVNVRELVIYLQDEIEKVLQSYQWEFNNQTVRNKIKDKADVICARIQHNGGIQDYINIMDESNNTPEIIDNEMAVLSTHIEPGRGMGKMVHELTIYRTGNMRSSITES